MSHISMGITVSLSGRYSRLGRQVLEGLECYVRDVNAAGGMRPNRQEPALPVSLVVEDDESDEAKVRNLRVQPVLAGRYPDARLALPVRHSRPAQGG